MGRIISLDFFLDWCTLFSREETNLHQSNPDADVLVYREERRATVIERKLPCGHKIGIEKFGSRMIVATVSTDKIPENLGIVINSGGQSADIYLYPESLLAIRDIINELSPVPRKWYEFWKS